MLTGLMLLYSVFLLISAYYIWRHRKGPFLTAQAPLPKPYTASLTSISTILILSAIAGLIAAGMNSTPLALGVLVVGALTMGALGLIITRY